MILGNNKVDYLNDIRFNLSEDDITSMAKIKTFLNGNVNDKKNGRKFDVMRRSFESDILPSIYNRINGTPLTTSSFKQSDGTNVDTLKEVLIDQAYISELSKTKDNSVLSNILESFDEKYGVSKWLEEKDKQNPGKKDSDVEKAKGESKKKLEKMLEDYEESKEQEEDEAEERKIDKRKEKEIDERIAKVNKELVTLVESLGVQAVGVSGKDGGLLQCKKKLSKGEDIGYVGEVTKVNPKILHDLLERDFLPIVFPIGFDENFDSYNINADDAACAIAEAVEAEKLAFLSDIEGVYRDADDPSTLISELRVDEAENLISDGTVGGGMIPKLKNCIDAIEHGVNRVHILDGRIPHSLLLEIFTNKGIGTAILKDDGEKYYNEHE